jgi:hypothetical protein
MELLSYPEVADALGLPVTRVHQLVRDGQLLYVQSEGEARHIPADFIAEGEVVKSLPAVIQLLRDARFSDAEIVDWLFREDETLPGTPIGNLRDNRGTEIKRRARRRLLSAAACTRPT